MDEKENIKLAFFLNLGFSIFELIGGLLTNSISIFSDAIHDFGDSIAIGISYILENLSIKKSDKNYTYGYKRYSVLGALATSLILIISSLVVFFNAFIRLFNPVEINVGGMLLFAIFGILINGYAVYKTSKSVSLNVKTVNLHVLEDVLGWIVVLIGSIVIKFTGWFLIDPLLSIVISFILGYKAIKNLLEVVNIIVEKVPENIDVDEIMSEVNKLSNVLDVHHVHVWSLNEEEVLLTMHVLVDKNVTKKNYEKVKQSIKEYLVSKGINHSTIEFEYKDCNSIKC